jgi:toxin YhaV
MSHWPMTKTEPFRIHGWLVIAHDLFLDQVEAMIARALKDKARHPETYKTRKPAKMLAAVARLAFQEIPEDPTRDSYQQGNSLGEDYRHWRRAKFYQQYRLFFRYRAVDDEKVVVFGWVNDETTKRAYGSRSDAYVVFRHMLEGGNPPNNWCELRAACTEAGARLAETIASARSVIE